MPDKPLETDHPETTHLTPTCSCEDCSAFTHVAARTLTPSPICDLLHRRLQPFCYLHDCSGCFPAGAVAGWDLHPLESAALSRRTRKPDIADGGLREFRSFGREGGLDPASPSRHELAYARQRLSGPCGSDGGLVTSGDGVGLGPDWGLPSHLCAYSPLISASFTTNTVSGRERTRPSRSRRRR
jgi:hypothetical protein